MASQTERVLQTKSMKSELKMIWRKLQAAVRNEKCLLYIHCHFHTDPGRTALSVQLFFFFFPLGLSQESLPPPLGIDRQTVNCTQCMGAKLAQQNELARFSLAAVEGIVEHSSHLFFFFSFLQLVKSCRVLLRLSACSHLGAAITAVSDPGAVNADRSCSGGEKKFLKLQPQSVWLLSEQRL